MPLWANIPVGIVLGWSSFVWWPTTSTARLLIDQRVVDLGSLRIGLAEILSVDRHQAAGKASALLTVHWLRGERARATQVGFFDGTDVDAWINAVRVARQGASLQRLPVGVAPPCGPCVSAA